MKSLLVLSFLLAYFVSNSQTLDLNQPEIRMGSKLHHMSTNKEIKVSERPLHDKDTTKSYPRDSCLITINTEAKTIEIMNQVTRQKLYSIHYSKAFQGAGTAVVLKPNETMFMVRDEKVDMIMHDSESHTMDVFLMDKQIELFGQLELRKVRAEMPTKK